MPLAVQLLRTLRQTYDHRGPNAFDEDATKVFHVIGWIIVQVCGRERLVEAMERYLHNQDIKMTKMLRTLVASAIHPRAIEYILVTAVFSVAVIAVLYQL
jgi:hypothetical protein